jgi:hypothetical protein
MSQRKPEELPHLPRPDMVIFGPPVLAYMGAT